MADFNEQPSGRRIVIGYIADKLRQAKRLIDDPLEYWREEEGPNFSYDPFDERCDKRLERLEEDIYVGLELAKALGFLEEINQKFYRIQDRNLLYIANIQDYLYKFHVQFLLNS